MAFVGGSPVAEGSSGQCQGGLKNNTSGNIARSWGGSVFPTLALVKVRYDFLHVHQSRQGNAACDLISTTFDRSNENLKTTLTLSCRTALELASVCPIVSVAFR